MRATVRTRPRRASRPGAGHAGHGAQVGERFAVFAVELREAEGQSSALLMPSPG